MEKTNQPLVSIIMTTYNRSDLIGEAISSVLSQSYPHWELLILDDASTDNTAEIVRDFATRDTRIKYLPATQNLGITKNRNRGLSIATGKYIAVLDSDDVWNNSEKLEKQVSFLESNPDYILVGTQVYTIDENGDITGSFLYQTNDSDIRKKILLRNQFTHSSVLFRKNSFTYPNNIIGEDYAFILTLGQYGKLANLPDIMTKYRIHKGSITKQKKIMAAKEHLKITNQFSKMYPHSIIVSIKNYTRILKAFI